MIWRSITQVHQLSDELKTKQNKNRCDNPFKIQIDKVWSKADELIWHPLQPIDKINRFIQPQQHSLLSSTATEAITRHSHVPGQPSLAIHTRQQHALATFDPDSCRGDACFPVFEKAEEEFGAPHPFRHDLRSSTGGRETTGGPAKSGRTSRAAAVCQRRRARRHFCGRLQGIRTTRAQQKRSKSSASNPARIVGRHVLQSETQGETCRKFSRSLLITPRFARSDLPDHDDRNLQIMCWRFSWQNKRQNRASIDLLTRTYRISPGYSCVHW